MKQGHYGNYAPCHKKNCFIFCFALWDIGGQHELPLLHMCQIPCSQHTSVHRCMKRNTKLWIAKWKSNSKCERTQNMNKKWKLNFQFLSSLKLKNENLEACYGFLSVGTRVPQEFCFFLIWLAQLFSALICKIMMFHINKLNRKPFLDPPEYF